MDANEWIAQFSIAYTARGASLSESIRKRLLSQVPETASQTNIKDAAGAKDVMMALLFQRAQNGSVFGDLTRVKQQFGRTLEENYGVTSGPFLALARAFWTFKIELNDLLPNNSDLMLTKVLAMVEQEVASVFFPTPGPLTISVEKRREAQRLFLQTYASGLDAETFLGQNPILEIEARRQRRGCSGVALAVTAAFTGLAWLIA